MYTLHSLSLSWNVYLFSVVPLVREPVLPDHHFSNSVSRISQGIDTVIVLSSMELYRGVAKRTPAGKSVLFTQDFLGSKQIWLFPISEALFKSSWSWLSFPLFLGHILVPTIYNYTIVNIKIKIMERFQMELVPMNPWFFFIFTV